MGSGAYQCTWTTSFCDVINKSVSLLKDSEGPKDVAIGTGRRAMAAASDPSSLGELPAYANRPPHVT
jgi:hypothetical protein